MNRLTHIQLLMLAFIAGCYAPSPEGGKLLCSADGKCPSGYSCVADACWKNGSSPPPALADTCQGMTPMRTTSGVAFSIDTSVLKDDFNQLSCTNAAVPGNDGFLAIDMMAGERWHFHVKAPVGSDWNPALYILPSCDDRGCLAGIDECGPGQDEHLSFVAENTARYIIGVDARSVGGTAAQLIAIRPSCGNGGDLEHSEPCDHGVNCDASCRVLLPGDGSEVEPNDDYLGANVMNQPALVGTTTVRATLGGRCDIDVYTFAVPKGGSVTASVVAPGGGACAGDATPLKVSLLEGNATNPMLPPKSLGAPVEGAPCPTLTKSALAGGNYYLVVAPKSQAGAAEIKYELRLEVK